MELPPVLQMITTEIPPNKLLRGNVVRLLKDKGFLKEISAQANFSVKRKVAHGRKSSAKDDTLKIYPTPALNPLSSFGKCIEHNCRVIQAESFARSIGLYCDHAEVTDFITPSFLTPDASKMDAGQLFSDMQCLTVLMPMIRAGIIRFSDPIEDMCAQCCKEVSGDLSEKLWQFVLKDGQAEFEAYEGKLSCNVSSSFFDTDGVSLFTDYYLDAEEAKAVPFLFRKVKIKNLPENALKLVKKRTTNDLLLGIHQVSEAAKSAADKAAILVTNSRQDAAILRKIDSGSMSKSFENWERLRSVQLPWVSNLSVEEIIRLREKAGKALPRFRDSMNRELFSISEKSTDSDILSLQVAKRLREEASELDAELSVAAKRAGHAGHVAIGTTAISCIIYGIGEHDPIAIQAGVTGLTATLASMYHPRKDAHADYAQLKTKPAYVLLSARDIIRSRKG